MLSIMVLLVLTALLDQAPTIALSGRVVDADERPLAGVDVLFCRNQTADEGLPVEARVRTAADGSFALRVAGEEGSDPIRVLWVHPTGLGLAAKAFSLNQPPAAGSVLLKVGPLVGVAMRIAGPDGRAVAGARVAPAVVRVPRANDPTSTSQLPDELAKSMERASDGEGRVEVLTPTPEDLRGLRIEAPSFGRQRLTFPEGLGEREELTLGRVGTLKVRVVSEEASWRRSARVRLAVSDRSTNGMVRYDQRTVTTNEKGDCVVPEILAGELIAILDPPVRSVRPQYRDGLRVEAGQPNELVFNLQGPPRVREVSGLVVNARGGPLADVTVWQTGDTAERTQVQTDAQGRFRLPGVFEGQTHLFARAEGHRFLARPIGPDDREVKLVLAALDEKPEKALSTLPPLLPRDEELALARGLLTPFAQRVLKEGDEGAKTRTLEALAKVDPAAALAAIAGGAITNASRKDMVRARVAAGPLAGEIDEALAIIEVMERPSSRVNGLLRVIDALPADQKTRKLALIDRALASARVAREPTGMNVVLIGNVARRWFDMGEKDRAEDLWRRTAQEAAGLPNEAWGAYAKAAFAEQLALVDPKVAVGLIEKLQDVSEFDRHHGSMAHVLAGRDPVEAERLLTSVRGDSRRDQYAARVVYRMAPVDLERARGIVAKVEGPAARGYAAGMMALAMANKDTNTAEVLLREAYDFLEEDGRGALQQPAAVGAALLSVAEAIDPRLVPEAIGRALALRPPLVGVRRDESASAQVAMMISRYDRDLAERLLAPLMGTDSSPVNDSRSPVLVALTVCDPRKAVALVEARPEDRETKLGQPKLQAALVVANVLGRPVERRWTYLLAQYVRLWVPDTEDHFMDL